MAISINIDERIYNKVYRPLLNDETRTQIFYGGSSSGKSFFLAQRCVKDVLSGGHNYLITRQVSATIRSSVFNEVVKAIKAHKVGHLFKVLSGDMVITCANGYQILFKGLDDEEKIKSVTPIRGVITDIWQEEATENKYEATKQLAKRLRGKSKVGKRQILSFNPIYKTHWIFKEYFHDKGWTDDQTEFHDGHLSILKTTYKDNEHLEPDDIWELENEKNEYYRNVYTYGNWGILGDVIFRNWKVQDLTDMAKHFDRIKNGLDFGFTNDPTAYSRSHYDRKNKKIYIFKEMYRTGMTNPEIAASLKGITRNEIIYADCAEPKSIKELNDNDLNVVPCKKGKDSILHGIQWLQGHEIIIHKDCINMINEATVYQWKKDKWGDPINVPVDKDNHLWDGIRYAYESEQGEKLYDWA